MKKKSEILDVIMELNLRQSEELEDPTLDPDEFDKTVEKKSKQIERNALGQNLTDDDYIRVAQFDFFTNDYFTNGVEYFFGSGIPFPNSSFGKWFENYHLLGMQYVDWGIIGVSWVLGILTAVAIVLFFLKGIRLKVDKEHKYLCLYLFFLLTTCITNWEMFRNGNFLVHAIVLYLIEQAHIKYKSNQLANVSQK